jgi:fatty acid desaturase
LGDVGAVTETTVVFLLVGLFALVLAMFGLTTNRDDRTSAMGWAVGGLIAFGAGAVAVAVWHWLWFLALMVIGVVMLLVAGVVREWRDK